MKNIAKLFGIGADKPALSEQLDDKGLEKILVDSHSPVEKEVLADRSGQHDIHYISVGEIVPNPFQPRKVFHDEALVDLSLSIKQFGVIQPLLVRRREIGGFELIAGERRLRASKLAELTTVPVIIKDLGDKEMAELAMIENLQREDLHYLEEAEGFQQLIANFGFTQEELAERVGKKQSTIANKLRLLKLSPEVRNVLLAEDLTERHARALLKIEDTTLQVTILQSVRQDGLNVRQTEELIEKTLDDISREMSNERKPKQRTVKVIRDVRIFLNTIDHVVGEMKKAGLKINVKQEHDDEYINVYLRIPKRKQ